MMPVESARGPGRNLTVEDMFKALETLDKAAGADNAYFRWRLRKWIRYERYVVERRDAAVDIGQD